MSHDPAPVRAPTSRRRWVLVALASVMVAVAAACAPPFPEPGTTSQIRLVSSVESNGFRFDFYRNRAYPCSISGYQTFTIATELGSSPTATKPLWTYMHGGGVGFFDTDGVPLEGGRGMTEESAATQREQLEDTALTRLIAQEPAGFRALTVSMCNRDLYGGPNIADPNNPNTTPDGKARTVNGLYATKAAVQFALATYPTDDYFLYGTSAGGAGSFHVAWSLEEQGIPPAGIVSDSGLLNEAHEQAQYEQGICGRPPEVVEYIRQRLHPDITADGNNPDQLVSDGRLTVPILQVWVTNDGGCGDTPMACPLRDGSTITLGSTDCNHEPLRLAIADQGAASRSESFRMCVDDTAQPGPCDRHVPTTFDGLRNSLPGVPADYNPEIVDWVERRRGDD